MLLLANIDEKKNFQKEKNNFNNTFKLKLQFVWIELILLKLKTENTVVK